MMIISASRRTDICAFHSEWFMNRLEAGYALVRNPIVPGNVHRVPLTSGSVDMFVFITKDPSPILAHIGEIESVAPVSFQVTITPYGRELEPNVPDVRSVIKSFVVISEEIGPQRTIWRYDPIVTDPVHTPEYHLDRFERMCISLEGHTERCIVSFLDRYAKTDEALCQMDTLPLPVHDSVHLVTAMRDIAKAHGMDLTLCCEPHVSEVSGIPVGGCLDPASLRRWNIPYTMPSAPQRKGCGCVRTVDIGAYDTCSHDCVYCYANTADRAGRRRRRYDPHAEMLSGSLDEDDTVTDLSTGQTRLF